jgi:hypothetical protein
MTEVLVLGMINGLGDLGRYLTRAFQTNGSRSEGCFLRILCHDKDGNPRNIDLCIRTLCSTVAEVNDILPSMRFVTFKTSGFRDGRTRANAQAIINYLNPILKVDPDPAVRALGRGEHVNAADIAKLIKEILKAMLKYDDPLTRRRRSDINKARWDGAAGPVVMKAGDGFADEVEKKAVVAQLERVAKRMAVMTEFNFSGWRPKPPEKAKKDAWRNQAHPDGTVGCWYDEVACNEEVKAACRVNCRGRLAHLIRKEVQFAHLSMGHLASAAFWIMGQGKRC